MSRLKHWMAGAVPLVLLAACPLALRAQTAGCYTLASLQGDWAVIGSYGANVGVELGVRSLDGKGNLTSSFVLNQPVQGSATGARTTATGTQRGTYTVNCDGTGQFKRTLTLADGTTATGVDDFLITAAVIQNGQAVATAIADAQQTSSTIVPGGVFLTRTHTARPAGGCYTLASLQGTYGVSVGYGANLALGLQPEILDGKGNLSRTGINNQLVAGTTTGERTITKVTSNGTYTVSCSGMGASTGWSRAAMERRRSPPTTSSSRAPSSRTGS